MRLSNSYQETKHILIIILLLTVIFSFNDGSEIFNASNYAINFILALVLVTLSILVHLFVLKFSGKHYGVSPTFRLWSLEEFINLHPVTWKKTKSFHANFSGPILAILITLISNGKAFFTALFTFDIKNTKTIGRPYANITEKEIGQIAFLLIFSHFLLVVLFKLLNINLGVRINTWIIVWNLIPFSTLIGARIFFGSRVLYIFTLTISIATLTLIGILSTTVALIISIVFAILLVALFLWYIESKL